MISRVRPWRSSRAPTIGLITSLKTYVSAGFTEFFAAMLDSGAPIICGAVGGRFVYEVRAHFDLYCKLVPVAPLPALTDASIHEAWRSAMR